jgi:Tripartite tricarboxylate transporter TctB family
MSFGDQSKASGAAILQVLARRDVLAGLMFVGVALFGLWLSRDYPIGTALRMGTGYVPRLLCWILLGLGVVELVQGLRAALASEASGQRGDSIVRAHSASEDARERADDTRHEPGSSARDALASEASGQRGDSIVRAPDTRHEPGSSARDAQGAQLVSSGQVWGWRPVVFVTASLVIFGLSIERLGLVLSILLLVGVGAVAARGLRLVETLAAALVLIALSWGIFILGLGLTIPVWPEW